ncbi:valine--pyruvate transaminase [Salmonella enterica subsp. enterica]|uniref:Valine--pyruvate transaminase n=1 Tax=Salmonella enterica I TaxID=59201 RepID=A0A379W0V1_SALET|nr:valine--pyruvate transaminase [Salmonella enterica subsp. enterica]
MMCEMIKRNDLLRLSETVIKPFYYQRVQQTIAIIRRYLSEERCLIHNRKAQYFCGCGLKICRLPPSYSINA